MKHKSSFLKISALIVLVLMLFPVAASAYSIGDVDGNGEISSSDARLALRASVNLEKYENGSDEFNAADVDADGKITSSDARTILRVAVGLDQLAHTHTYSEWTTEKDSSGKPTGKHYRTCSTCNETEYEDCTYGEKIYTKQQTCTSGSEYYCECTVCSGKTFGGEAKLGHIKSKKIDSLSTAATCTQNGTDVYYCDRCKTNIKYTVEATGHKPDIDAATCTRDKICTLCGTVLEAKHHTDADNDSICDVCKTNFLLDEFNSSVNVLKDGNHTVSGFGHSTTEGKVNKSEIKYSAAFKTVIPLINLMGGDEEGIPSEEEMGKMFSDEFNTSESTYALYSSTQKLITDSNFPIAGNATVSELTQDDITKITETTVTGVDFLDSLPDSITIGSVAYSLARYKNAELGELKKITVELKSEKYTDVKDSTAETALMHIGHGDIRDMAKETVGLSDSNILGDYGTLSLDCNEVTSNATVTYYFDAETGAPVAAEYNTSAVMANTMDMSLALSFELPSGKTFDGTIMSGNADFTTSITEDYYYFFDNYFPEG